jgi:hypothetical protein
MDNLESFLHAVHGFLDAVRASAEQELTSSSAATDAAKAKRRLEGLNVFLNEARFSPGGICDAITDFCNDPSLPHWEAVLRKIDEGKVIQAELAAKIKRIDSNFAARNTDLLRILQDFVVWKANKFQSLFGIELYRLPVPTDPTKIEGLRDFVHQCDTQNKKIDEVQSRIKAHLDQLAAREEHERDRLLSIAADTKPRRRAAFNLLDVFSVLLLSSALGLFLVWIGGRLAGRPILEELPPFVSAAFSNIWTSLLTASGGIAIAIVRNATARGHKTPSYLAAVLVTTAILVGIAFAIAVIFNLVIPKAS